MVGDKTSGVIMGLAKWQPVFGFFFFSFFCVLGYLDVLWERIARIASFILRDISKDISTYIKSDVLDAEFSVKSFIKITKKTQSFYHIIRFDHQSYDLYLELNPKSMPFYRLVFWGYHLALEPVVAGSRLASDKCM